MLRWNRWHLFVLVIGSYCVLGQAGPSLHQTDLLEAARTAIGGGLLAKLTSVRASGRIRILNLADGRLTDPGTVEFKMLFPDHFRRDQRMLVDIFRSGVSGDLPLSRVTRADGSQSGDVKSPSVLLHQRQTATRFLAGWLLRTGGPIPLSVTHKGSHVIEFAGKDLSPMTLELDGTTTLPKVLSYMAPVRLPVPGQQLSGPPAARDLLVRIEFSDYRVVNGLRLAHTIVTTAAKDVTLEDIRLERIETNVPLTVAEIRE